MVASGLARRCVVHVSYAIRLPKPLSVYVDTNDTGKIQDGYNGIDQGGFRLQAGDDLDQP